MLVDKEAVLSWLATLQDQEGPPGAYRHSESADATPFSSCFAANILSMLDGFHALPEETRTQWSWELCNLQQPDTGFFTIGDLPVDANPGGHDRTYVTWQLTTFCLSALAELDRQMPNRIVAMDQWHDTGRLQRWLNTLNWRDPWCEGNRVMFLCIMLLWDAEQHNNILSREAVNYILYWHDEHQRPESGFWGEGFQADYLEGMGGALHQLLIYFYLGRPVPRYRKIVDRVLLLQQRDGMFAPAMGGDGCTDYDVVDILVKFHHLYNYRRHDIKSALERFVVGLEQVKTAQGGFLWKNPDNYRNSDWVQQFKNFKKHNSLPYLYYSLRALLSGRMHRNHPRMPQGWTRTGIPVAEPDLFATFMRILAASLAMEVVSPGDSTRHCTYLKTPGLGWHFASPPLNPILTEEIESIGTGSDYTTD